MKIETQGNYYVEFTGKIPIKTSFEVSEEFVTSELLRRGPYPSLLGLGITLETIILHESETYNEILQSTLMNYYPTLTVEDMYCENPRSPIINFDKLVEQYQHLIKPNELQCSNCGSVIKKHQKFCSECGQKI